MRMVDLIEKKRDGQELSTEEIKFVITGYTNGEIADYQMSAFLMAVYFQNMTERERADLTLAMAESGDQIDLSAIDGIKVDKHSTGGVGDTTTLVLGPLVAACGVPVAKMSGRGLGHTGGTIDKLEAIDGFHVELSTEDFIKQVNDHKLAVNNQAMFDFEGNPLESLNVYKYVFSGTTAPLTVTGVQDVSVEIGIGEEVVLPETVPAILISGSTKDVPVVWNADQIAEAQETGAGSYQIEGTADVDGEAYPAKCMVDILKVNFVKNPGFEESDMSMWNITGVGVDREDDNNKRSGTFSLKFWDADSFSFCAEQQITGLQAGTYELGAFLQGGDAGSSAVFTLYITVDGQTYTADSAVTGWSKWDEPHIADIVITEGSEVTVGVKVESGAGGWGAWDDFYLYKMD